jgi:GntR family transcriptional regulator/MocR family aminotransferase
VGKHATVSQIAGIELERTSDVPLHRQIDAAFRRAILEGRLSGGTRIPSSRALAEQLGVSRLTVTTAFEQLTAEGYLESRVGSGTTVARVHPTEEFRGHEPRMSLRTRPSRSRSIVLSRRGIAITSFAPRREELRGAPRPFRLGAPALDAFPYAEWVRIAAASRRRVQPERLGYGDPAGYWPLREAIAAYLGPARAVRCAAENVIVVNGAQQAFGLALRLLTDPGDSVWIEDPGYPGARGAAIAAGTRITPVRVDREGLKIEDGAARGAAPRLVFVTPSHQFPLGTTMSLARRLALLEWSTRSGAMVVEDDYGCEYRYTGRPLSALQGLDTQERVIYVGTFSKVLFPALRLAYLVVPTSLVDAFSAAKGLLDSHAPLLEQATLADFITGGHFVRHIARMRRLYRERQAALIDAIQRRLNGLLDARSTATGMHLVGWLPRHADDRVVARAAAEAGIDVAPVSSFRVEHSGAPGLVLGFASSSIAQIEAAIARLGAVLRTVGPRPRHVARTLRA